MPRADGLTNIPVSSMHPQCGIRPKAFFAAMKVKELAATLGPRRILAADVEKILPAKFAARDSPRNLRLIHIAAANSEF